MTDTDLQVILQNGVRLHKMGDLEKAESCYQKIIEQAPAAPNTLHYLSLLKGQQKNYPASADYAKQAINLAPENAHYHYTLANALKQQDKLGEAVEIYQKALALQPEYMEASYQLGETLVLQKQWEEAITAFKQALTLNPTLAEAYLGIGVARMNQEQYEKAIPALTEATTICPNAILPHFELARAYMALRMFSFAKKSLEKVLAIDPEHHEALYLLAEVCYETRDFVQAITTINKLISLGEDPRNSAATRNYANAYASLGVYLQITGDFVGSEHAFLKALSIDEGNVTAYAGLEEMDRFPDDFHEVDKIKALLMQPDRYKKSHLAFLHITLSRLLEKQNKDDEAFEQLRIGKQLKHEESKWSIEPTRHAFDDLINFFTPEFMKAHEGVGNPSEAPIFIVSMPRSGSSLTEQILASHSQVFGAGELGAIPNAAGQLVGFNNLDFPNVLKSLTPAQFNDLGENYLTYLRTICPPEFKYFTDKLPANFRLIGFILLILPNAKIVHCVRNPIETCFGCYKQVFRDENLEYTNDLSDIGHYYQLYDKLMAHWKKLFPHKILDVYYEQMVADQETQSRRLLDFCGLAWEGQVLDYHKAERPIFTASSVQVRKPIYSSALNRWKRYEKHLGPLLDVLGPIATNYPH